MFQIKLIVPTTKNGTATITNAISNGVKCDMTYTIFDVNIDDVKMKSGR